MADSSPKRAFAKRSRIHGTGLFASTDIEPGQRIIEYTGERITKTEATRRYERQAAQGAIYLFDLNKRYDIDGATKGNEAKYANHSCDPNAETDIIKGQIWVLATKPIKKGEEITYDYNFPTLDYEDRVCRCGKPNCRGYIVGKDAYRYLKRKWAKESERQAIIDKRPARQPVAVVKRSPIHDKGLFAATDILKDERIVQYTGERVDKDEAARRYEKQAAKGHIFLFELDDDWDIDGSGPDNKARWANHSCDPNAETEVIDDEIWLIARRDIPKGEEVTYDYNLPLQDHEDRPCACGAEKCRGYVIGRDSYYYLRRKQRQRAAHRGRNGHRPGKGATGKASAGKRSPRRKANA